MRQGRPPIETAINHHETEQDCAERGRDRRDIARLSEGETAANGDAGAPVLEQQV
jgi:hypothetical protein